MFQYVSMPLRMDDGRFVSAFFRLLFFLTPNAQSSADWDFEDIMDLLEDSNTHIGCWKMLEDAGSEF